MSLSSLDIEQNVADALAATNATPLIDRILRAYGHPAGSVTRLRNGALNKAKEPGDLLWKGKLFYRETMPGMLLSEADECRKSPSICKHKPRFIIISDGTMWAAYDTKTQTPQTFNIADLQQHYDFFLPWADYEKEETILEKAADIKAAQKMGELYDAIKKNNKELSDHDMNVFMARLLFCFFAEDSGIFPQEAQFTNYISEHSAVDGSDLHEHIERVFLIMNTPDDGELRQQVPHSLAAFPYVNGGLFRRKSLIPQFTPKALKAILAAGKLDWSDINTDIFGSMFQACVDSKKRANLGEHYTSVPNIKKVLKPLFLDKLEEDAEKAKGNLKEAQKFIDRLSRIRCFDPACGSGNFLLIAFEEMRKLEMDVLEATPGMLLMPSVSINQFYGIEIDDFPHEIAMLSLWLVEHQMNQAFEERFGTRVPTLPLKPQDHIVLGNALCKDWNDICPRGSAAPFYTLDPLLANAAPKQTDEVYVFGNPPYLGGKKENEEQKAEQEAIFSKYGLNFKDLDYVSCWFILAAEYIQNTPIKVCFVGTNSITQGTQVPNIWKPIFSLGVKIEFAYSSFKWTNNAKYQAGVTCVIIGLADKSHIREASRYLYKQGIRMPAHAITPYLTIGNTCFIKQRKTALSPDLPPILFGNAPVDDGNLVLTEQEKSNLIKSHPETSILIKKYIGSEEFIKGKNRYCLWIEDKHLKIAQDVEEIRLRLQRIHDFREKSPKKATQKCASLPHKFIQRTYKETHAIIIPLVSSERRTYIPIGYVDKDTVISNLAFAVYDAEAWVFGILASRMHMAWVRMTGSKLKTDFRYSASLCYNTFPLPKLSEEEKERLEEAAYNVLDARESYLGTTPKELYNPNTMPDTLRQAHDKLDQLVDSFYRKKAFQNDDDRLDSLFNLYQQMTTAHE